MLFMEDKAIIELLFARSEEALIFLKEKYEHLIIHILVQILSNIEDVDECKNDVYLAVWNSIPPNNPDYFKAYICKVARNIAMRKVKENNAYKRSAYTEVALDELGECISLKYSPNELLEAKEVAGYLNLFLRQLSERNRTLFVRRYFFGDSVESLSKRFSMQPNTVTVKLSRLRKSLKAYLVEQEVYM